MYVIDFLIKCPDSETVGHFNCPSNLYFNRKFQLDNFFYEKRKSFQPGGIFITFFFVHKRDNEIYILDPGPDPDYNHKNFNKIYDILLTWNGSMPYVFRRFSLLTDRLI